MSELPICSRFVGEWEASEAVGWQLTLCDPIWQVTLHDSVTGFLLALRAIHHLSAFTILPTLIKKMGECRPRQWSQRGSDYTAEASAEE